MIQNQYHFPDNYSTIRQLYLRKTFTEVYYIHLCSNTHDLVVQCLQFYSSVSEYINIKDIVLYLCHWNGGTNTSSEALMFSFFPQYFTSTASVHNETYAQHVVAHAVNTLHITYHG